MREDDTVVFLNRSARHLLAVGEDALLGSDLRQLFPDLGPGPEGSLARSLRAYTETRGGASRRTAVHRPDDLLIEVEVTTSETSGGPGGSIYLLVLRRVREAIDFDARAEEERSYQLVFENAPVGIFHFDRRGVITACNDRFVELLGSSKQLLIGLDMRSLPNKGIVHCVEEAIAGRRAEYDGEYVAATGTHRRLVRVAFAPIHDAGGAVAGGVGIVEDVTDARRAQQALARADRMASLGVLAAGIAHEINNPLAFVLAALQHARRALEGAGHPDPLLDLQRDALEKALEGCERVRRIVGDLGVFSRVDERAGAAADLVEVLESAVTLAFNQIRHRARLTKNYGPGVLVRGDEARLVQVFLNLLLNAAQAIPDGDAEHNLIEITVVEEPERAVVEVRDTGGGIPEEIVDRIFEPFFTTKPIGQGTGLGLSVCHGIVRSLGGEISAHSTAGGTTLRVALPRADPSELEVTRRPPVAPREARKERAARRILFIDDEVRLTETLALALAPHQVVAASSGAEAMAILARDRGFDLVLCDLMIPDRSGPEIHQHLVEVAPELASRFVFVSGGAFTESARRYLARSGVPLLHKPFDIDAVERLLEEQAE